AKSRREGGGGGAAAGGGAGFAGFWVGPAQSGTTPTKRGETARGRVMDSLQDATRKRPGTATDRGLRMTRQTIARDGGATIGPWSHGRRFAPRAGEAYSSSSCGRWL